MPSFRIPQTGTTIDYPPAKGAGRMRITARLQDLGTPTGTQVELSFKRDPFSKLFKRSNLWYQVRSILVKLDKWPVSLEEARGHLNEEEMDLLRFALPRYDPGQLSLVQSPDAHGRPIRLYVERRIDERQAEVVRRIFQLYADGHGFGTIARQLNDEGALCPRPSARRPTGGPLPPYGRCFCGQSIG